MTRIIPTEYQGRTLWGCLGCGLLLATEKAARKCRHPAPRRFVCRLCENTGRTEYNTPCDCPAGDVALFNHPKFGAVSGGFLKGQRRAARTRDDSV